jgi:hypothetical protein
MILAYTMDGNMPGWPEDLAGPSQASFVVAVGALASFPNPEKRVLAKQPHWRAREFKVTAFVPTLQYQTRAFSPATPAHYAAL